ncbi:zinc finger protein 57-like [Anopheles maculipalpis]|uniref:zinc finger protein 57-like n=1 Tax=Anopheles maculipalpis TaxID=1496333 RepID=UPI002159291D|nr:zinc finger protein 57-like [Anopheles maculipalpis]
MDHLNNRNAINDPNQCRLCMRVCDDNFLEYIFTDKEYSIAHQIFECTSIRVTKQDNLTKICKNCASLLFLTTEFRNACFKTNRLLMEDFVILELDDWASDRNQLLLRECETFIVRHKQQVDYLYASIVTNSDHYLDGSLAIGTELFGEDVQQRLERKGGQEKSNFVQHTKPAVPYDRLQPCEPDPEILIEITKFLEEQTPSHQDSPLEHTNPLQNSSKPGEQPNRCSLCCTVGDAIVGLTHQQQTIARMLNIDQSKPNRLRSCNECCLLLDAIDGFQKTISIAQELSQQAPSSGETLKFDSIVELGQCLVDKLKHKQDAFAGLRNKLAKTRAGSDETEPKLAIVKKSSKRTKVACHICGKQYDSWKLKTHLNEHDNIRPYACDQEGCSSTFTGLVLLNRHKKLWHTDYFYAACSICGKKCKTQGIYKTHLTYHEEPKLPCTVCGKLMRNKRAIWKHMKTHSNDRKHVCGVCNKTFTIAYTLRVHMRIHTNDKPYPCARCDKRFQYKCLLKNHFQRYHTEDGSLTSL